MAKEKKQSRKDDKGRVLRKGESQRKDGTYMYRYMDECKKRHSVYAKTLPELREKALKIEKDKMNDIRLSVDYTVDQLVQLILEIKEKNKTLANHTKKIYRKSYKCHIKGSWLAEKKVRDVKKADIIFFYTELSNTLSNTTIQGGIHRMLHQAFELALEDQIILKNPVSGAAKDFPRETPEKKTLTQTQLDNLLMYLKNNPRYYQFYLIITIFTDTMMRGGELCGLTWNDIDLKQRTIKIDHQLQYDQVVEGEKCKFYINKPKTKSGIRQIPLTNQAYDAFMEIKNIQLEKKQSSAISIEGYHNFVFLNSRNKPLTVVYLNSIFKRIETAYNKCHNDPIPHITCHVFRHTGCTLMAKKMFKLGIDPKILQQWMGHSTINMTLELYNHAEDYDSKFAMSEINNL